MTMNLTRFDTLNKYQTTIFHTYFISFRPMERRAFFSETNLEVLCKVSSASPTGVPFDIQSTQGRQNLYEVMLQVHEENDASIPISDLNKQVLLALFADASNRSEVAVGTHSIIKDTPMSRSSGANIRDLETHSRPVPTVFQERPQQTSLAPVYEDTMDKAASFQSKLQAYESTRAADTPSDRVTDIDFSSNMEDDSIDSGEAERRMQALKDARERNDSELATAGMDVQNRQGDMAAALEQFDDKTQEVEEEVQAEQERLYAQREADALMFKDAQTFTKAIETEPEEVPLPTVASEEAGDGVVIEEGQIEAEELSTSGAYWLDESVRLNLDTNGRPKLDQCAFQDALQLTREKRALDEQLKVDDSTLHERLLLPPPKEYGQRMYFLEISSIDRVRTANIKDTPYDFTVYFGTTMPSWRTYPIWLNTPIDYDVEDPDTAEIRRSLGLQGFPAGSYEPSLDDIVDYIEVPIPSQNQNNIDTVLKNVIELNVQCVQIYFANDVETSTSGCPQFPYLMLEIQEFQNVVKSTSSAVRKSFCKLYYDKSNCNNIIQSKHHEFIPRYNQGMTWTTPIASIDRLRFRLLTPYGRVLSKQTDTHLIRSLEIDEVNTTLTITLHKYVPLSVLNVEDYIRFQDLEWYKQSDWIAWDQSITDAKLKYDTIEQAYKEDLKQAQSDEEKRGLKQRFEQQQAKFDYPTLGYPVNPDLVALKAFIERPEGHYIKALSSMNGATVVNQVVLQIDCTLDEDTGDCPPLPLTIPTGYSLMNGVLLHDSFSTNISLSVVERNAAPTIPSANA